MHRLLKMGLLALVVSASAGCGLTEKLAGETSWLKRSKPPHVNNTVCRVWGSSLPTRSRSDTPETQDEIEAAYVDFAAACPKWRHLIP